MSNVQRELEELRESASDAWADAEEDIFERLDEALRAPRYADDDPLAEVRAAVAVGDLDRAVEAARAVPDSGVVGCLLSAAADLEALRDARDDCMAAWAAALEYLAEGDVAAARAALEEAAYAARHYGGDHERRGLALLGDDD
ncbi:MAG: hypothetical protein KatS3mg014_2507 [Actinomycetota bacterium]|nr:MAG: hypothetical protein KatS3mg014_2498 [Actinomycetota bacterium]GIV00892.1 MAG: hypothetical protein KatS3mg014_2507 [Actinomycetota bacterium]